MDYSTMRRRVSHIPGISTSYTDEENHSVFDFPIDATDDIYDGYDSRKQQRNNPKQRKKKKKKTKAKKGASHEPSSSSSQKQQHPYPSSISISMSSPDPAIKSSSPSKRQQRQHHHHHHHRRQQQHDSNEFRSPATSPGERHFKSPTRETRQPNSPTDPIGEMLPSSLSSSSSQSKYDSELTRHHAAGRIHFHSNRLSEAVDSYSLAIRVGLEELSHRKDMIARMTVDDDNNNNKKRRDDDELLIRLGTSLAQTHIDLGKALEVAQKYGDAKSEWENALGMLLHTCRANPKRDERVRALRKDVARMDRAVQVKDERERRTATLEEAYRKLNDSNTNNNKSSSSSSKEEARRGVVLALKKLMRIERDTLGERSYAHAKLKLKLAKVKCEGGDIEGGMDDAHSAARTIQFVLGGKHALVGAACLFAATVHEKRASMMMTSCEDDDNDTNKRDKSNSKGDGEENIASLSPECKATMNRALELYADALEPLKFKYENNTDNTNDNNGSGKKQTTTTVQPDVGEAYHKIAKLYGKKGSHASSVDSYHRALEAYGATGFGDNNRSDDVTKTKKKGSSSSRGDHHLHPEAVVVWRDLAEFHLNFEEHNDAVYAGEKAAELARTVLKTAYSERMEAMPVSARRIIGDAYGGMNRHEDAARSYREAIGDFRRIARGKNGASSSASSKKNGLGLVEEARLLRKLGMSYLRMNHLEDAKNHLLDALRVLRSGKEGENSADLPGLLADIGLVHVQRREISEAEKALQLSLKMYEDRGTSNRSSAVERVRRLYDDARHGRRASFMIVDASASSKMVGPAFSPSKVDAAETTTTTHHIVAVGTPSTASTSVMETPQTADATPLSSSTQSSSNTHPPYSAAYYSRTSAGSTPTRSGHGQLQTLLEELTTVEESPPPNENVPEDGYKVELSKGSGGYKDEFKEEYKSVYSPPDQHQQHSHHSHNHHHRGEFKEEYKSVYLSPEHSLGSGGQSETNKTFASKLKAAIEFEKSRLEESHAYDLQRLEAQLQEAESLARQYRNSTTQMEMERDREKTERIEANVFHRKEVEALRRTDDDRAAMEAELESLRKEVEVSERSYQELSKAIDDEKERMASAHDADLRALQEEVEGCRDELRQAGAIENNRLSEELGQKRMEIASYREQSQESSEEIMALQSRNRTLQSEKEAVVREVAALKSKNGQLQTEIQRLSSELSTAKAHVANSVDNAKNDIELKKLEFELQSERSRRMILESHLQKEYDQPSTVGGGSGGGNMSNMTYPMSPMQMFGYPPMMQPMSNNINTNENINGKLKILEIDLATERASKEMLDNVIQDLRTTHQQEMDSMQSQYSASVATHEREVSDLLTDIGNKEAEVTCANQALATVKSAHTTLSRRLEDTEDELFDLKEQLSRTSCDLSNAIEDKRELSDMVSKLESVREDLVKTEEDLHRTKKELTIEKETVRQKESEGDFLSEENERLKKEYNEAISLFESEMDRAKIAEDDVQSTLFKKMDGLNDELGSAKLHLKNVLSELEVEHQRVGELERDAQQLKMALDSARDDVHRKEEQLHEAREDAREDAHAKEEQLHRVRLEIEELTENYDEVGAGFAELERIVSDEKRAKDECERVLDETRGELSRAQETVEELNATIAKLESEKGATQARLAETEDLKTRLNEVLSSISKKLEGALPGRDSTDISIDALPDDENNMDATPEILTSDVSSLLKQIGDHAQHLNSTVESRDTALEKMEWKLSNASHDIDVLEAKNRTLKEGLKEMEALQSGYDELAEQYELVVEEKEALDEQLEATHLEREAKENASLMEAQEARDLFESRLKEAVDDLEELECERDEIRVELGRVEAEVIKKEAEFEKKQTEFDSKEESLRNRIRALETDNELIEKLESDALEYDAALSQKDSVLQKLQGELQAAHSELKEAQCKIDEVNATLRDKEEEIIEAQRGNVEFDSSLTKLEDELQVARSELADAQCTIIEVRAALRKKEEELDDARSGTVKLESSLREKEEELKSAKWELQLAQTEQEKLQSEGAPFEESATKKEASTIDEHGSDCCRDVLFADIWGPDNGIYPDIHLIQDDVTDETTPLRSEVNASLEHQTQEACTRQTANPFDDGASDDDEEGRDGLQASNGHAVDYQKEAAELEIRVLELESLNRNLTQEVDVFKLEQVRNEGAERVVSDEIEIERERFALTDQIETLKEQVETLEERSEALRTELACSKEEVSVAATVHENNVKTISSLQKALDEKNERFAEELDHWKNQVDELQKYNGTLKDDSSIKQTSVPVYEESLQETTPDFSQNSVPQGSTAVEDAKLLEEIAALKRQVIALEEQNAQLSSQLSVTSSQTNQGDRDADAEQITALKDHVQALEDYIEELSAQIDQTEAAATEAKRNEQEVIDSLQCSLNEKDSIFQGKLSEQDRLHQADLDTWRSRVTQAEQARENDQATIMLLTKTLIEKENVWQDELQHALNDQEKLHQRDLDVWKSRATDVEQAQKNDQMTILSLQNELNEKESGVQSEKFHQEDLDTWKSKAKEAEKARENDQITILSLQNALVEKENAVRGELQQALSNQGNLHQQDLATLTCRAKEAEQARENDQVTIISLQNALVEKKNVLQDEVQDGVSDQATLYQREVDSWKCRAAEAEQAHENDQVTITSLRNALVEKESVLQDELQDRLSDQEKLYRQDLDTWKARAAEAAQARKNDQASIMLLKNKLVEKENALHDELHQALNEQQKENQKLKEDIELFESMKNSKAYDENRNFEEEMNAAHARFVSMEKALEDRVSRLEKEKEKLVVDFNAEMANQEEEHIKTKVELSAWKLEMQNALNDIESLKKERDELRAQVESYTAALEAVCIGKAELEEKLYSLKSSS